MIESGLLSTRIFLAKASLKIGQEKYLQLICICKTNPWKLGYATGVTSNLAAKSAFIALKVEVDK